MLKVRALGAFDRAALVAGPSVLAAVLGLGLPAFGQGVQFPADANVVNVTSYGATPSDGTDDTAAFQAALNAVVNTGRILYVPDGVYNLSDRLNWGGIGSGAFFSMQGQSQAGTILKLNDNAAGFDGAGGSDKVFIDAYEGNTANAFQNYLQDLTIDIGSGNAGAIGLQFQSNNTGRIQNVTVRSGGPGRVGRCGLDLAFQFPGPFLAQDLTVEGFDIGIRGAPQEYSVTFDNLTLRNQNVRGMEFWRLPVQIRNLVSQNSVPVLRNNSNPGAWGHIVIDGGSLTGGSASNDAILNENSGGVLILRDITTAGYRFAVNDQSFSTTTPITVPNGTVAQFTTDGPASLNPSPAQILGLPVESAPAAPSFPLAQWVNVKSFGAIESDNLDDTDAIRAAMNSGAPVVYFPTGEYRISDTITIGPSVVRVEGLKSSLSVNAPAATEGLPVMRIAPGGQPVVHITGVNFTFNSPGASNAIWVRQDAATTLVLRDGDLSSYRNTVPGGKVFLENIVGGNMVFTGQRVWARQLNPEGSVTHVVNDAGDFYVLGLKTEGAATVLETINRGRSVVMGGLIYPATAINDRTKPMFVNRDSAVSIATCESAYVDPLNAFAVWVRETRGGVTTDFTRAMLPLGRGHSDLGGMIALYNGYQTDTQAPTTPGSPSVASTSLDNIELSWPAATDALTGIARYNVYLDGVFYRAATTNALSDIGLPDATTFNYAVTAVDGAGNESALSGDIDASTLADDQPPRVTSIITGLDPRFVKISFSEPVTPSSGATLSNYAISGPAAVVVNAVTLAADARSVTLTTSPLVSGSYALTLGPIADRTTAGNSIAPNTTLAFGYTDASSGTGLTGRYYASREFIGTPLLTRVDPTVNLPFSTASPGPGVPADNYAVRWVGQIRPRFSETYTLFTRSDDGARLFIDGRLVINRWQNQGTTEVAAQVPLDSSRTHDIVVEYYEATGGAEMQLLWQSPSQTKEIVPQAYLTPEPRLVTIRTFDGNGADAQLDRFITADGGSGQSIGAFHSPAAGGFHDAGYYRFDLTSLDLANNSIDEVVATLSQTFFGIGDGRRQLNFFGVNNTANADNWVETGAGNVTWDNAVGNNNSGGLADPATATFVSTILLDNTGFQNNNQPDKIGFSGQRLLDFLRADTDGKVTFLFKRVDASNEGQSFFTKEWNSPSFAPALRVRLTPKCPVISQEPVAPVGGVLGRNVQLFVVATGQGPLSYQWRRNGLDLVDGIDADGSIISGSQSSSLSIQGATCDLGRWFDVTVTNTCGNTASTPISLVVCPADVTCDEAVDFGDFLAFFNCFDAGAACGDLNADQSTDFGDFLTFFNGYDAGC
jgi:hypothetical protein